MPPKTIKDPSVKNEIGELKISVARMDERLKGISDKQDCIQKNVTDILSRMDDHGNSITKYKSDRNWVASIFGALYAGMLAWIEYRVGK